MNVIYPITMPEIWYWSSKLNDILKIDKRKNISFECEKLKQKERDLLKQMWEFSRQHAWKNGYSGVVDRRKYIIWCTPITHRVIVEKICEGMRVLLPGPCVCFDTRNTANKAKKEFGEKIIELNKKMYDLSERFINMN